MECMNRIGKLPVALLLLSACSWASNAQDRLLPFAEAQKIALMVASHDHYTVDDRTIVLNSMDTRSERGFIPGYYTFSIIRESTSASEADDTVRIYVVSKRTADTWELNLCKHYSFPELEALQQAVMKRTGASPADEANMAKTIGCTSPAQAEPTSAQ
jgi:hypothetical protein